MTKTKRKHCYRPLLKVMETVVLIKDVLRRQLQLVGDELTLGWSVPNPQLMGSMHYRLATRPSAPNEACSDVDMFIVLPKRLAPLAYDIRERLARRLLQAQVTETRATHANQTVKWHHTAHGMDASVLLALQEYVDFSRSASEVLRSFYETLPRYRSVVSSVMPGLRKAGVLNQHGLGAIVGASLKTVSFAILCAGLRANNPGISSERELLWSLATFDADLWIVVAPWDCSRTHAAGVCGPIAIESRGEWERRGQPLLLLVGGVNSARRVTHVEWARFQYHCHAAAQAGHDAPSSLFPALPSFTEVCFDFFSQSVKHYRFMVETQGAGYWHPAVISIWPKRCSGDGTLIVLSGNGNDVLFDYMEGYSQIIAFSWGHDHTVNPTWLPQILILVAHAATASGASFVDLMGFSRGVQGVMCTFHSHYGMPKELAEAIRRIFVAGGCIWQRQWVGFADGVLAGMRTWQSLRQPQQPLSIAVMSRNDAATLMQGAYSKKKRRQRSRRVIGAMRTAWITWNSMSRYLAMLIVAVCTCSILQATWKCCASQSKR